MKKILLKGATLLLATLLASCGDRVVGYLDVTDAAYLPDSLEIPRLSDLDPVADATRLENDAPWVSLRIQGVLGTPPLYYAIESARERGGTDVAPFLDELSITGGGIFYFPLRHAAPPGEYTVSIRVYNEGHARVLPDIFTFIVK
jgi:hypothetical protein